MLDVYKNFYKLADIPFRLSPDHRFSFGHHSYREAKAYLEYAIFQGEGFITITGRPGTGKTTLIGEITSRIDKSRIRVAMINSTQLDTRDLLHMVAASFGLQFGEANKVTLLLALEHFLIQQNQKDLKSVLIVDEAQGLSRPALEELRLLANLQHENRLLLQVCLVGQEQLRELIGAPDMEHFRQRLIAAAHLDTLNLDETITYIEHRLCCAGWDGDPSISEEALRRIYQSSGGIPRKINLICNRIFIYGGIEEKHHLRGEDAELMIKELQEEMLLAADEENEGSDTDLSHHETGKSARNLPRGEMLKISKPHSQPEPLRQSAERTGTYKTEAPAVESEPTLAETARRAQSGPNELITETPPAQLPPDQVRIDNRERPLSSPEEKPVTAKNSPGNTMMQAVIVVLLLALFAYMMVTDLPQNLHSLLKNRSDDQETVHPKSTFDAGRKNDDASAIPAPKAGNFGDTKKPALQSTPAGSEPEISVQPAIENQVVTTGGPQAVIVNKAAAADKPQATEVKNNAPADTPAAAVAEHFAALEKPKTTVANQAETVKKPQIASEENRPHPKDHVAKNSEPLIKNPGQSLPETANPATAVALKNKNASSTSRQPQPTARPKKPDFSADKIKTALLAGRWSRGGQPTRILPSEVTFCNTGQQVINCWSVPQKILNRNGEVTLKIEATLNNFANTGEFQILFKTHVKPIDVDQKNENPWQVTEGILICEMLKPDTVLCKDQQGKTKEYHRARLSR